MNKELETLNSYALAATRLPPPKNKLQRGIYRQKGTKKTLAKGIMVKDH